MAERLSERWKMKTACVAAGFTIALVLAGCGDSGGNAPTETASSPAMPDVMGLQLDVALGNIESAGFMDEVTINGGGTFGVVDKSNWTVCEQSPMAGAALVSPILTVDRECSEAVVETSPPTEQSSADTTTVDTEPSEVIPTSTAMAGEILNVGNSPELAAILAEGDYCADSIAAFASAYRGRTIEFDGHIADVTLHEGNSTRWDFLIAVGDAPGVVGPSFKFEDVGRADLNLTDESIPGLTSGDNLSVVAKVLDYNEAQCLLFLDPVSTGLR